MKILADRLTPELKHHSFSGSEAWWKQRAGRRREIAPPTRPFEFELDASTLGPGLLIEGEVVGELELECSRCVARYRLALREAFRLVLEPVGEQIELDPEAAEALSENGICLSDDMEQGWYRGTSIDIEAYLAEVIALAMPVQPVCRDECAGLCPECGANRNQADCGCSDSRPNSPFAVLEVLRTGPSEGKP